MLSQQLFITEGTSWELQKEIIINEWSEKHFFGFVRKSAENKSAKIVGHKLLSYPMSTAYLCKRIWQNRSRNQWTSQTGSYNSTQTSSKFSTNWCRSGPCKGFSRNNIGIKNFDFYTVMLLSKTVRIHHQFQNFILFFHWNCI